MINELEDRISEFQTRTGFEREEAQEMVELLGRMESEQEATGDREIKAATAKLSFTTEFDERTAWEVEQKGWFDGAIATLSDGTEIPLSFWDPTRLAQELKMDFERGSQCFAEPALIIVPAVTERVMRAAVAQLSESHYFARLIAPRNEVQRRARLD